jgi:glycosyltransferase involved in cell wall biosynthesis
LTKKKTILFVGSFRTQGKDGGLGGQMFACNSLINSELKNEFDWVLIDTSSISVPPPGFMVRMGFAIKRLVIFVYSLGVKKIDSVLLFTGAGAGFVEKGLMLLVAKLFAKRVIIAPRSGHIIEELCDASLKSIYIKYVFLKSDLIVCQSERWRKIFLKNIPSLISEKLRVVENWINTNDYNLISQERGDGEIFVFMGWMEEKKGIFDLVQAIKSIDGDLPSNVEFHFAGNGSEFNRMVTEINDSNLKHRIKMLGWVRGNEKTELLSRSSVVILPSYVEGYPNVLIEAMAAGNAVIGSTVGGIPDLLCNGRVGVIIKEGNVPELASAILRYSKDRSFLRRMALEGKNRVIALNDVRSAVESFKEIL